MFRVNGSAAGPPVVADAPLASDNDNPAAPNSGRALLRRFRLESCFACDMVASSWSRRRDSRSPIGIGSIEGMGRSFCAPEFTRSTVAPIGTWIGL